jgi:hypothetical protein
MKSVIKIDPNKRKNNPNVSIIETGESVQDKS